MASGNGNGEAGSELAVFSPGSLAKFAEMVTLIPAESEGGANRIFEQIMNAETWEALNDPWEASKADQLAGRVLRLDWAERRPSDFRDGLGMFLVLHCFDLQQGKEVVVTTSAVSVVGAVVRGYALNALPMYIEFIIAARPTKDGYHPHHIKVHSAGSRQQATADASAPA